MICRLFGIKDFFRPKPSGDQEGVDGRPGTAPEIWGNAATMEAEHEPTDAGGLSRRQLVTRGAIAGGLVWAAPIIRTTAAYATTANGTEKPCQNFYMVVINPAGHVLPAPAQTQGREVPPRIRQWFRDNEGVTVQFPSVTPQLTAVSDEEAAVLLPEVTGPNAAGRQCRLVLGYARKGNTFAEAFVDPDPQIAVAVGRRLIFPCPRESNSLTSSAIDSSGAVSDSTSTSTTTAVPTPDPAAADPSGVAATGTPSAAASSTLGGDASSGATVGSDGRSGPTLGADGAPSTQGGGGGGGGGTDDHGNGRCFSALYLIYCCPR